MPLTSLHRRVVRDVQYGVMRPASSFLLEPLNSRGQKKIDMQVVNIHEGK